MVEESLPAETDDPDIAQLSAIRFVLKRHMVIDKQLQKIRINQNLLILKIDRLTKLAEKYEDIDWLLSPIWIIHHIILFNMLNATKVKNMGVKNTD